MSARAVLTGIGVVAPNGIGTETWWKATRDGVSGIRPITRFDASDYDTQLAGEVDGFTATDYIDQRLVVATDRWTQMGLAATQLAFEDAGFSPDQHEPLSMSVITASSSGGNEFGQKEIAALWDRGPKFVGVYQSIAWFYAATTGQIAIKHGMKGANGVVVTEGAAGLDALSVSRRAIRRGSPVVVSGGTEASVSPYALVCQMRSGRLTSHRDPASAYQPFGAGASGYVPGEGGAILLVEELDAARARGAGKVYAEIAGYGATSDGYHHTRIPADGVQYARAIRRALDDAGVTPDDIDVVFADATGTPDADAAEVRALQQALGDRAGTVPVTAPKTMVGRLHSGGAPLDVAAAALAMRDGVIPPTVGTDELAEGCSIDLVRGEAREASVDTALLLARGFGGFNSALVLRRVQG